MAENLGFLVAKEYWWPLQACEALVGGPAGLPQEDGAGDFPGGPVAKVFTFQRRGVGSIPVWRAKMLRALQPKNRNMK